MKTEKHLFHPLPKKLVAATWSALSVMAVMSMSAHAQTEPVVEKVQRVEVTGSSIKRVDAETALPVQILTRKDIEKSGAVNAEQLLAGLSANTGYTKESASISDKPGSSGLSGANLRGLGISSTLVLLNGRRLAAFAFGGEGTDLNSIPISAIDRVEVLKDGASAVYGADAVGGVINFITRKDYRGTELSASGLKTQQGGGNEKAFSALVGLGNLETDRFNAFASVQYQRYAQLKTAQRDFADSAWKPFESRGYTNDLLTSSNPFPAAIYSPSRKYLGNTAAPNCEGEGIFSRKGRCRFDYQAAADVYPESNKTNLVGKVSFALTPSHTLTAEYTGSRNKASYRVSPTGINGNQSSLSKDLHIAPSSPFYPASYVNDSGQVVPTNGSTYKLRVRLSPGGPRTNGQISDQQRLLLGSEGTIAGWDYNTAYAHSISKNTQTLTNGYYDRAKLKAAFDSGLINPFGAQNAAGIAALDGAERNIDGRKGKSTNDVVDFRATKQIAELSAGAVSLATGAEFRREKLEDNSSDEILSGSIYSTSISRRISESRNVKALFGELEAPLVKNLTSTLAVRYDSYGGKIGSSTNPKLALRYQPSSSWLLRTSVGTGFRAPTLKDLDPSSVESVTSGIYSDPIGCKDFKAQCPGSGDETQIPTTESGNPNLKPEKSKQFSAGVIWEPSRSFSAGVDYWMVKKTDVIKFAPESLIQIDPYAVEPAITRDSDGFITNWELTAQNQGKETKSGLDLTISGRLDFERAGKFSAKLSGTRILKSEQQFSKSSIVYSNLGKWGFEYVTPTYRQRLSADWEKGNWNVGLVNTYQSSYEDQNLGPDEKIRPTVKAYVLWDMNVGYYGFKGVKLTGGILNLLNTDPPFSNQNLTYFGGFDSTYADPRGRSFYAKVTYAIK